MLDFEEQGGVMVPGGLIAAVRLDFTLYVAEFGTFACTRA